MESYLFIYPDDQHFNMNSRTNPLLARRSSVTNLNSPSSNTHLTRPHRTSSVFTNSNSIPLHQSSNQTSRPIHIQLKPDPSGQSLNPNQPSVPSWLSPMVPSSSSFLNLTPTHSTRFSLKPTPTSNSTSNPSHSPNPSSPLFDHSSTSSRFKRLVQNSLPRLQLQLWPHRSSSSSLHSTLRSNRPLWIPFRILSSIGLGFYHLIISLISIFWVPRPHRPSSSSQTLHSRPHRWITTASHQLGLGRKSYVACLGLLILGTREVIRKDHPPDDRTGQPSLRAKQHLASLRQQMTEDPFGFLHQHSALPELLQHDPLGLSASWIRPRPGQTTSVGKRGIVEPDTTAVILNWRRPENVQVIVAHLCRYDFFRTVVIWNNDSTHPLKREVCKCLPQPLAITSS